MKYFLLLEGTKVGYSLLDVCDDSMCVVSGEFFPNHAYRKYAGIFAEYSKVRLSDSTKNVENVRKRMNELSMQINHLNPVIVSETGKEVVAYSIVLEDFSIESGSYEYDLAAHLPRNSLDDFFSE